MMNRFAWADLSTMEMSEAKRFYRAALGWSYRALDDAYVVGAAGDEAAAGLYPMPEKFRAMGMPSFWMSYILVEDIDETVRLSEDHGAKVEVRPQAAPGGGRVALIRDPSGAGFTCYEGDGLGAAAGSQRCGQRVWHELHVSDLSRVEAYYAAVFGWAMRATAEADRYEVVAADGRVVAGVRVTPNAIKGDKEYWAVYFAVDDLGDARRRIERAGGEVVTAQPIGGRQTALAYDTQGAAFYVMALPSPGLQDAGGVRPVVKWRAMLGLGLVAVAVVSEWNWVWGLLFLLWVLPDLWSGSTHFFDHVERRRNPVLYWLIVATWVVLCVYLLLEPVVLKH